MRFLKSAAHKGYPRLPFICHCIILIVTISPSLAQGSQLYEENRKVLKLAAAERLLETPESEKRASLSWAAAPKVSASPPSELPQLHAKFIDPEAEKSPQYTSQLLLDHTKMLPRSFSWEPMNRSVLAKDELVLQNIP